MSCLIADGYLVGVVSGGTLLQVLNASPAGERLEIQWHHDLSAELELLDVSADAGELGYLCAEGGDILFGVELDLVDVVEELDFCLLYTSPSPRD